LSKDRTIVLAAVAALRKLGRPARVTEIYESIIKYDLYVFNTSVPQHVLRTTIRRHTKDVERADSFSAIYFSMVDEEVYGLLDFARDNKPMNRTEGLRRIYRARDKEDFIEALTSQEIGVFREIWRILLFASQVGIQTTRREELGNYDRGKGIDQSTFGNSSAWPGILHLISLADTGSPDVLASSPQAEEDRIRAFEEYANGGLAVLQEHFSGGLVDLDGLLSFIDLASVREVDTPDLEFKI
jgi:dnd system-associated protein 4